MCVIQIGGYSSLMYVFTVVGWRDFTVLQSRSQSRSLWSRNYLRPGAGAEINMYCSQFGGCCCRMKKN